MATGDAPTIARVLGAMCLFEAESDCVVCWLGVVDGTIKVVRLVKMPSVGLRAKV